MKMWILFFCIALHHWTRAAEVIQVFGYEGADLNFSCPYKEGYEPNEKYLCKNKCSYDDVLVTTEKDNTQKYSIHDNKDKHTFTMTVSNLSSMDAGTYWCMVSKYGADISTKVNLETVPDSCCDQSTKHQSDEESSVSFSCPYESKDQNNLKYICRGRQPSICLQQALITSDNKQQGRFSLTDNKVSREFTVTITSLILEDSGSYLCGVRSNTGLHVFTAVDLDVKEWCCVESSELSGIVGGEVSIQCLYPSQHRDNRKFICKGDQRKTCTDVMSEGRFSLQDNISSSSFLVRVTELEAEDAGTYWCGSDPQWRVGNYTKIQLSISQAAVAPPSMVAYILPAALALLMILIVTLVMAFKFKCHKGQGGEVNMDGTTVTFAADGEVTCGMVYENAQKTCMAVHFDGADHIYCN